MANGVLRTFRVECYPSFWIIHCGNSFTTTNSSSELLSLLKLSEQSFDKNAEKQMPRVRKTIAAESLEAFYARNGETAESLRRKIEAEKPKPPSVEITLEFLLSH